VSTLNSECKIQSS